ncbi:MAG: 5'/3'-nucleotidase SurE [Anaerolineales bacterium]|nr:5'/3'-nucleotidase SurE [Anaerolineales bacterium]
MKRKPQILLTNDDGIESPGLWAAADALEDLGYVHVVAPRDQQSGTGRSLPEISDGIIDVQEMHIKDQPWTVYAVGGTPAQAVLHAYLEILEGPPDLVVAGINYGQNVGNGVTISGTVGAALEAAALGIPALAISLEMPDTFHLSYSKEIDFSCAAHFTKYFGRLLLEKEMPHDVDVLKVEIPSAATSETPWELTRISPVRFYETMAPRRETWKDPGKLGYQQVTSAEQHPRNSDVYVLGALGRVSVTPLSLDLTSRLDFKDFDAFLRE